MSVDLKPLFDRVVVRRVEEEEQQKGGIIIPDSAKEKPQRGDVVAVGRVSEPQAASRPTSTRLAIKKRK